MTDDLAHVEEQLRVVLTTRAGDITPKDLYDVVVRRARRRITVVVASAIAAAVVAVGVPIALGAVRSDAAPAPGPAAGQPTPTATADPTQYRCPRGVTPAASVPGLPAQQHVSGSLGGDPAAVAAVARAAWGALSLEGSGALDPALTRVEVAHRAEDGGIVGLATGRDRSGRLLSEASVVGPDLNHLSGLTMGLVEGGDLTGQRFSGGDAFVTILECGPRRVLAIVPPGGSAEATWITGIAADGTVQQETPDFTPRPDGLVVATLAVPPNAPASVRVSGGNSGGATTELVGPAVPKAPSFGEMARKLQSAPGNLADRKHKVGLVYQDPQMLLPVPQRDVRVLWAGEGAGKVQATVAVSTLPSGAKLLWGSTMTVDQGRPRVEPFNGVVAAGALDRNAYRLQPSEGFVLPGRARPQGIFFTGTRRVDITLGKTTKRETVAGGVMVDEAATVVVYDTDGMPLPLVDVRTDLPRVPRTHY